MVTSYDKLFCLDIEKEIPVCAGKQSNYATSQNQN